MGRRRMFMIITLSVLTLSVGLFLLIPSWRESLMQLVQLETIAEVRHFVETLGVWGPVAMIALMIVHSVTFIPAEVILLANVLLFGPIWGIVYTWIGSMLGAYLSYFLAQAFGRPIVEKFISNKMLNRFDQFVEDQGVKGLFVLRLIPVVSFNALNYAAGFTKITLSTFTWTTGIGIVPALILFTIAYESAVGQKYAFIGLTIVGIVILAAMLGKAKFAKKYQLKEQKRAE